MTMTPAVFFFISGVRREKYGWLAGLADTMNECNVSRIPLFVKMHGHEESRSKIDRIICM